MFNRIAMAAAFFVAVTLMSFVNAVAAQGLALIAASDEAAILSAIARDGKASVIFELEIPGAEKAQNELGAPLGLPDAALFLESRRAAIADASGPIEKQLSDNRITVTQAFENLPQRVALVDAAGFERLLRIPGISRVYFDAPLKHEGRVTLEPIPVAEIAKSSAFNAVEAAAQERAKIRSETLDEKVTSGSTNGYINANLVHNRGFTGSGQVVVILDDGIERTHSSFSGRIATEACFSNTVRTGDVSLCPSGAVSQTGTGAASNCGISSSCGHGTHVAGIAAGANGPYSTDLIRGVAYGARIIPIQVFTQIKDSTVCDGKADCLSSYTSSSLAALNHVISLASTYTIASVNMSLGGSPVAGACDTDSRKSAIDTLRVLGILTAIAAGNEGQLGKVSSPGCISTAVTVSSVIITIPDSDVNHASNVDMLAPGYSVFSAIVGNSAGTKTGTSMATPHVAGAIALLRSAFPTASALSIENALKNTGILSDYIGWTWKTPRIDVNAAYTSLASSTPVVAARGLAVANLQPSTTSLGQSFLRLYNSTTSSGTVTVTIYNDVTDEKLGVWTKTIPANSSLQVGAADIERETVPRITPAASQTFAYNLYVERTFTGFFQHVLYNPGGKSLTNVTGCEAGLSKSSKYFGNVHTSRIGGYPSYLLVHNNSATAAKPSFKIYDSVTGSYITNFTTSSNIASRTSAYVSLVNLLQSLSRTPGESQFHLNLELDGAWTGVIQHFVNNEGAGVVTDMTSKCDL